MLAWRLCRAAYADLSGEGARRFGGRWNTQGRAVVYAAQDAALAVLEVRVHLDLPFELLPADYVLIGIDLTSLAVEAVATLPDNPASFGDAWLAEGRTPVLRVPSVIVPECTNILLNPRHAQATEARIVTTRALGFDGRLWG